MSSASSVSDKVAQDAYVGSQVDSIPPPDTQRLTQHHPDVCSSSWSLMDGFNSWRMVFQGSLETMLVDIFIFGSSKVNLTWGLHWFIAVIKHHNRATKENGAAFYLSYFFSPSVFVPTTNTSNIIFWYWSDRIFCATTLGFNRQHQKCTFVFGIKHVPIS